MRILHVISTMDPADGGPPVVVGKLAAAQAALTDPTTGQPQHRVTIACHARPHRKREIEVSLQSIPHIDQVRMAILPPHLRFGAIARPGTGKRLRELLKETDIAHLHGMWSPVVWKAAAEARRLGVPYVIAIHGMLHPWALSQKRLKKQIALALTFRKMLQNAACLHVLNAEEAKHVERANLKPPKRIIPNGVFPQEIEDLPPRSSFYAKHPELNGQPYVMFLGRLHHVKGLDYLADAFGVVAKRNPQLRLVVAGPNDGAEADFAARIEAAGVSDRVHMIGPLWGRDKFAAMVDAACYCQLSRQEGFSMAITEALGCGTPVVISENCNFPEVAQAGAGEVVPLELERIVEAMQRVLSDDARRAAMGEAARNLVLSRFTWPAIAQQATAMYEEVALRSTPIAAG